MPKVSMESATQGGEFGPVTDRSDQLESYTVNFTSFREDVDATPMMKGLPDDRCQCPHWGYMVSGSDFSLRRSRGGVRSRGCVLHAARPRPRKARTRHRVRDVQPCRRASQDRGGHDEEHGGDADGLKGSTRSS
jgi:hypothetical protein